MFRLSQMSIFSAWRFDATKWSGLFSLLWVTVASPVAAEMSWVSQVQGFVAKPTCRHSVQHVDAYDYILAPCALSTGENPRRFLNFASCKWRLSSVASRCKWRLSSGERDTFVMFDTYILKSLVKSIKEIHQILWNTSMFFHFSIIFSDEPYIKAMFFLGFCWVHPDGPKIQTPLRMPSRTAKIASSLPSLTKPPPLDLLGKTWRIQIKFYKNVINHTIIHNYPWLLFLDGCFC